MTCQCSYSSDCLSPRMEPSGNVNSNMLLVGEAPGKTEDERNKQFQGVSGIILNEAIKKSSPEQNRDLFQDFLVTNVMRCRPAGNHFPEDTSVIQPCLNYLEELIRQKKPSVVVAVGGHALSALLPEGNSIDYFTITKTRGLTIPSFRHNCWVVPVLHPASFLYNEKLDLAFFKKQLSRDINLAYQITEPVPQPVRPRIKVPRTVEQVARILERISGENVKAAFDYETTGLEPDTNRLLSVSIYSPDLGFSFAIPLGYEGWYPSSADNSQVINFLRQWLVSPCQKIVTEINMEVLWSYAKLGVVPQNIIRDTTVMTHIADQRQGCNSLEWRVFTTFGVVYKSMVDRQNMEKGPAEIVLQYNGLDAWNTYRLYEHFESKIISQNQATALDIFSRAGYVYSEMTCRGIKIDLTELNRIGAEFDDKKSACLSTLQSLDCVKQYNLTAKKTQLWKPTGKIANAQILFQILQEPVQLQTPTGKPKLDKIHLALILEDTKNKETKEFLSGLIEVSRIDGILKSAANIRKTRWLDGKIHPKFKLSTVTTYRSSSSDPNLQNQHKRGEGVLLRKAFLPTNDYFVTADYGAMEVRVIAYLSKDPVLLQQLKDGLDLHAYWTSVLFRIPFNELMQQLEEKEKKAKALRYSGKNGFVFPLFYGSWHGSIAAALHLPLSQAKAAETFFWRSYRVAKEWQNGLMEQVARDGYLTLLNGFRIPGPLGLKEVANYVIQGPASHYLAAASVDIQGEYKRKGFESFLCGQIHDDLLTDAKKGELKEVVRIKKECLEASRFGIESVPLISEFSIGRNWLDMREI